MERFRSIMVDPFATSLAGFTLAMSCDRLLIENPQSNSVLSLHPALSIAGSEKPSPFETIEEYTVSDQHVEVAWRPVQGVRALTTLRTIRDGEEASCAASRLQFQVSFTNTGEETVEVESFHPIFFPPEGPGACALGFEGLRTLASRNSDGPLLLKRLHGRGLQSAFFGSWFSASGSPTLLIGPLESGVPRADFQFAGVRGKMLSLRVDSPAEGAQLAGGESCQTPLFLILLGALNVNEEIEVWSKDLNDPEILDRIPDFQPSDELVEEELPEELDEPDLDEVSDIEEGNEDDLDTDKDEDDETVENLTDEDEDIDKNEDEEIDDDEEDEELSDALFAFFEPAPLSRCARFRRAMRATRGFQETGKATWPRWASGRRYEPYDGCSARTRGYWRVEYPKEKA